MKYIKLYEYYKDIDPFDEEDWDEIEEDGLFITWLNANYPDKSKWNKIKEIDCQNNQLTSLIGIEQLENLKYLYINNNKLKNLKYIENLVFLKQLDCSNNELVNLDELSNLNKLEDVNCFNNKLLNIDGIKKLKLRSLYSPHNNFSFLYRRKLDLRYMNKQFTHFNY